MATFTTTPGDPGANSYATVAEADDYLLERRLHVEDEDWKHLGNEDKEAALMWAVRSLDQFEFIGSIASTDQALQWPRISAVTKDGRTIASNEIPAIIKDAQAEIALALVKANIAERPAGEELEALTVGPIKLEFRDPSGAGSVLDQVPEEVENMIRRYLRSPGIYIPIMRA